MLVDQDESWFSRFKQPKMHSFAEKDARLRLVERQPKPSPVLEHFVRKPLTVFSTLQKVNPIVRKLF